MSPRRRLLPLAAALGAAALAGGPLVARAQFWKPQASQAAPPVDAKPRILEQVGVEERLGAQVPLGETFLDDQGRPVELRSLFTGGKPVVLALVYYDCPMLCGLIQGGMARAMRENGLRAGTDFRAVSISFSPAERPALAHERRRGYLQSMGLDESSDAWSFWVDRGGAARRLADALGFHYAQDPRTGEWAHMAAIFVLSPSGKVSRYLYGIEFPPKDFRLALVEAADGKVGTTFDRLLLTCFRYDPSSRRYLPFAMGMLRLGGGAALLGVFGLIAGLVWRERRKVRAAA